MIYISAALLLTPRPGATTFIVCVIAGQMLTSMTIDHFGLRGLPVKETSTRRLCGVALILGGVCLIQYFSAPGAE